ncbi:hypothetical protein OESDEN_22366 [Oesophagostomum dentatum]|uniref:Uncharacterized protein n=1 Tax=Oesophagostomum dentatum TaxID=61180 RepID=A0A0B1RZA6_OESDE|nr:hypothetical protein OESDEN_22366 [Oesophagostomum dentatum]
MREGDNVALPPNLISSDTNYLSVVKVNDSGTIRAGTYRMTMSGAGGQYCQLNIRGRSAIEIYPAYVSSSDGSYGGTTSDKTYFAPVLCSFLDTMKTTQSSYMLMDSVTEFFSMYKLHQLEVDCSTHLSCSEETVKLVTMSITRLYHSFALMR